MPITMYDSIYVSTVPRSASSSREAVAGYVGGHWPDYWAMVKAFPQDHHLSIAVNAHEDADCLDIEAGDAVPAQAPAWVRRQHARGVARPCLYASLSTFPAIDVALVGAGIARQSVRLWVADWTRQPHIPPGYDACQWTDRADGRDLDESLCLDNFFATHTVTHRPKQPVKKPSKVKQVVKRVAPAKPHPKVTAVGISGVLTGALLAFLNSKGAHLTHLTAVETDAVTLVAALLAGYLTPGSQPTA